MTRPMPAPAASRPAHPRSPGTADGDLLWRLAMRAAGRYWPVVVVAGIVAGIVVGLRAVAGGVWWPGGVLAGVVLAAGGWWLPRPVNLVRIAGRRLWRPDGGPRRGMWRLRRAAVAAGLLLPGSRLVAVQWQGRPGYGWRAVLRCPRGSSPQWWAARAGQLAAALRREVTITDMGAGQIEITATATGAMARVPHQPHPLADPPRRRP